MVMYTFVKGRGWIAVSQEMHTTADGHPFTMEMVELNQLRVGDYYDYGSRLLDEQTSIAAIKTLNKRELLTVSQSDLDYFNSSGLVRKYFLLRFV